MVSASPPHSPHRKRAARLSSLLGLDFSLFLLHQVPLESSDRNLTTAGMISHRLFQKGAKQTHPSLQNLSSLTDFRPCHRLGHSLPGAPNPQVCEMPESELDFQDTRLGIFPGNGHFKSTEVADMQLSNLQHVRA